MPVKTAKFISSYPKADAFNSNGLPQFAFIGRSNVGKSTLINTLCNHKDLAKTSSKPGKTRLINSFLINNSHYFVDLPGYGYAKVSKKLRNKFSDLIADYVTDNPSLFCLFVLIDGSIPPQAIDLEFIHWAGEESVPVALVFTKKDKAKKGVYEKNVADFHANLYERWDELPVEFHVSSKKKIGIPELDRFITQTIP